MTDDTDAAAGSTYPAFLLDYLYVDVARLRSYLAQLAGGVATTASEALEQAVGKSAEASVPVARGGRSSSTTERWETTRALGDLIVTAFEEEATAAGFLIDVSDDLTEPDEWYSGAVHRRLPVGTIFRLTTPARLLDPEHVAQLIQRFEETAQGVARLTGGSGAKPSNPKSGRVTPKGGSPAQVDDLRGLKKMTEPIRDVVSNLLAGGISLRAFPCGLDHPDCGFGGLLLDRSDYIEPERAALFARHGVEVSDWTVVGTVTRLPVRHRRSDFESVDPSAMIRASGAINRQALEGMVLQLLDLMEGLGMSEGPAWPSIAFTPLAVYRTMPRSASLVDPTT